jgi:hypothetical protein
MNVATMTNEELVTALLACKETEHARASEILNEMRARLHASADAHKAACKAFWLELEAMNPNFFMETALHAEFAERNAAPLEIHE